MVERRTRVFLAGGLCIETPHGRLPEEAFPGRQTRHCFARLTGARGLPVSREELAEELWPGDLPVAWETAIRAIVSKLRAVLVASGTPGATVSQVSGSYRLSLPADTWLDISAAADAIHVAEAALSRGDAALAARDAQEAIRLDPFRETSHRLLIRALLAAGDRAAAIRAFERCRRSLREELGVDPSPETATLVAGLRSSKRGLDTPLPHQPIHDP